MGVAGGELEGDGECEEYGGVGAWARMEDAMGGEEGEGQPGQALQLVDVLDLGEEVAAEGEDGGGERRRERF